MYARFENGLVAEIDSSVRSGDVIRAYVTYYFDHTKKYYFTSKVIELLESVSPSALFTTDPDLPFFEGNNGNDEAETL